MFNGVEIGLNSSDENDVPVHHANDCNAELEDKASQSSAVVEQSLYGCI